MNHADVLSTVASDAYLGDVAEGWDKELEFKTRVRLHKSATMVPPEAAMKVRSLNKHRLQQIVDKVSDVVREEENIMKTFEEGMHAVLKKEAKKALLTTSQVIGTRLIMLTSYKPTCLYVCLSICLSVCH